MKKMVAQALACVSLCVFASAHTAVTPPGEMSQAERESLSQALGEAGNSPVDFVRILENHISKYPNSPKRSELERALVKSAMDLKDNGRIIRWGERVLEREPDDLQILERVTVALLQTGGTENEELALKHAEHFEQVVKKDREYEKSMSARDLARRKDEHDRAEARGYLIEARSHGMLGHTEKAIALAVQSYQKFSSVEAAREAARWLDKG